MNTLRSSLSPRVRLVLAAALLLGLTALGPMGSLSMASVARGLLGVVALAGLGWWLHRRGSVGPGLPRAERLHVISRAGLSQRCGLALVEVDGRGFLVAFGDSFAEIRETPAREPAPQLSFSRARRLGAGRRGPLRRKAVGP
jgi:flagellar biogenesis protein FliO